MSWKVTRLQNEAIRDNRLSFRARGLLHYLLSFDDPTAAFDMDALVRATREGRDAVRTAVAELRVNGYLISIQTRGSDGRIQWEHELRELSEPTGVVARVPKEVPSPRRASRKMTSRESKCGVCVGVQQDAPTIENITYLVRRGMYVKIGTTRNLDARLKQLARPNPGVIVPEDFDHTSPLRVIGMTVTDEHELHQRFQRFHIAGEWFRFPDALSDHFLQQELRLRKLRMP